MVKYVIEGGINFYDELYKSLEEDDVDSNAQNVPNRCLITDALLEPDHVKLLCGHVFNYKPLYTEIQHQKRNYNEKQKKSFIKCPYCRKLQEFILPPKVGFKLIYGINTLNENYIKNKTSYQYTPQPMLTGYFNGICDYKAVSSVDPIMYVMCDSIIVTKIENNKCYCANHRILGMQQYWNEIKAAKKKLALEEREAKKKQKELEKAEAKKKQLMDKEIAKQTALVTCCQILKTGSRKGEMCGCKVKNMSTYCQRHTEISEK
jgi:hypothetical protein